MVAPEPAQPARARVESEPPGAAIIDPETGVVLGLAPVDIPLGPTLHRKVRIEYAGNDPVSITLRDGQVARVKLRRAPGDTAGTRGSTGSPRRR